ncbi:TetR/AcrR family transcriptional regulator [Aeromicrobium sp. Marseille-Q0843]|uniref:TetR/AcrR family transcriptional regulator n=1 Tax=Aeromicrobium phoceense TaxID=2754045 RepID=A0A838XBN8_9ACTN|nr:TetR/AcrR family transcriptional regulator [Aeromicrobium phoceense]MBA4608899.1 TetR/AcrR family transcriptional regulator [Aeromicrobium phoceense]
MARGRPREHQPDVLLDHARALWVEHGATGVTMRALSARAGAANGVIYNAFGSRDNLLARVWVREAVAFLRYQRDLVEAAVRADGPQEGIAVAALSLATYARTNPEASRLLLAVDATDLLTGNVGPDERNEVERLRLELGELITRLAEQLWQRTDRRAVALVRICVVDLPAKLLLSADRLDSTLAHHALREAVRGITSAAPPA